MPSPGETWCRRWGSCPHGGTPEEIVLILDEDDPTGGPVLWDRTVILRGEKTCVTLSFYQPCECCLAAEDP